MKENLFDTLVECLGRRLMVWSPKKEDYFKSWETEINSCVAEIKEAVEAGNITKEQLELDLIKHYKISNPNSIINNIKLNWYHGYMSDTTLREPLTRDLQLVSKTLSDVVSEIVSYFYDKRDFTGIVEIKSYNKLCTIAEENA